jgi:hypothetical protein
MDLERKVALLKASYLHSYAANIAGIEWCILYFFNEGLSREASEEKIGKLYQNIERITDHDANKIPFLEITQEMAAEDWDDFAILFRIREILPKVKEAVDRHTDFLRSHNYYAKEDSGVVRIFLQVWGERFNAEQHQGMDLKARIEKYDPKFRSETGV